MKVFELLGEEAAVKGAVKGTPAEIAAVLKDKCGEFVAAYKKTGGKMLYRGVSGVGKGTVPALYSTIRTDRRPVEMPEASHKLISDAMEKIGLPSRRNGLFATAQQEIAKDLGATYAIFVEDGWEGVVFEGVGTEDYAFDTLASRADDLLGKSSGADATEAMVDVIDEQGPVLFDDADGLAEVIRQGYMDIIIRGRGYYALKADTDSTAEVLSLLSGKKVKRDAKDRLANITNPKYIDGVEDALESGASSRAVWTKLQAIMGGVGYKLITGELEAAPDRAKAEFKKLYDRALRAHPGIEGEIDALEGNAAKNVAAFAKAFGV